MVNVNLQPITFTTILTTNGRHSLTLFFYKNLSILKASTDGNSKPFIGFSGTKKFAQYPTNTRDEKNDGTPNCEKNKLIFRLDQKNIDMFGCNNEGRQTCSMLCSMYINVYIKVTT